MEGIFSVKSDVFSLGVIILEIISGKKNNKYYHLDNPLNLVGYVSLFSNSCCPLLNHKYYSSLRCIWFCVTFSVFILHFQPCSCDTVNGNNVAGVGAVEKRNPT